jgi:hypothetical protein
MPGYYVEVERYGNEVEKDPNGIMPDKEIRHRPAKDTSDRLFYSPSIRQERVDTLRRICEWFDAGWKTYQIAKQLNAEGVKPVHSDHWYSAFIDGLLDNTVLVGKPAWNRTSQSTFRHLEGAGLSKPMKTPRGCIASTKKKNGSSRKMKFLSSLPLTCLTAFKPSWKNVGNRRPSGRPVANNSGWAACGGMMKAASSWRGTVRETLQGQASRPRTQAVDVQGSRVVHRPQYLDAIGQRIDHLGRSRRKQKVVGEVATEEWMKELRFEYIVLEIESFLRAG